MRILILEDNVYRCRSVLKGVLVGAINGCIVDLAPKIAAASKIT